VAKGGVRLERELDVLQRRSLREQAGDLERARDAEAGDPLGGLAGDVAPGEDDPATRRLQEAGEQMEQGGLAGAVGADQRVHGPLGDTEVHVADRAEALELLGQALRLQDGCGVAHAVSGRLAKRRRASAWP
jgi:hypothetical protein